MHTMNEALVLWFRQVSVMDEFSPTQVSTEYIIGHICVSTMCENKNEVSSWFDLVSHHQQLT